MCGRDSIRDEPAPLDTGAAGRRIGATRAFIGDVPSLLGGVCSFIGDVPSLLGGVRSFIGDVLSSIGGLR
jgi:hypothetical protein